MFLGTFCQHFPRRLAQKHQEEQNSESCAWNPHGRMLQSSLTAAENMPAESGPHKIPKMCSMSIAN